MTPLGLLLIVGTCAVPLIWLPGIAQGRDVIALFSQYLGIVALITMAIGQVIATRWRGVETIFGPLDKSYRIHKWLGITAMAAVLLHDTIDAEMRGLGQETLLVEVAETAGEISLYGLLILVVITVATFIPYHLWKWTHRFIGVFFVMGAGHYLFILKPFSNGDPLGLYTSAICLLGLIAYAYTSAPRSWRGSRRYVITRVTPHGDAVAVDMAPKGKPLRHRAGQFAFFAFEDANLPEPHPFTISSAPDTDGTLRVTVAPLGDLTHRVTHALAQGQELRVDGPYGRFGQHVRGQQVWIGAGIGITPFAALAQALNADAAPVTLIYCIRTRDDAAHLSELESLANTKPNLTLVVWESLNQGRLTAQTIANTVGDQLGDATVLFCGPVAMRKSLGAGLGRFGVSPRKFHYEEFEIRTGLGLKRLFAWVLDRHQRRQKA